MNAKVKSNTALEIVIIFALGIIVYMVAGYYDALESIVEFSHKYEDYEIDEIIIVFIFLVFGLTFFSLRRWRALIISDRNLKHRNIELQKAFEEIKQLRGYYLFVRLVKKSGMIRATGMKLNYIFESARKQNSVTAFAQIASKSCIPILLRMMNNHNPKTS